MNLIEWTPFREMDDLFGRYNRLFGRFPRLAGTETEETFTWRPVADISETEKEYVVKAELPEVKRDDVDVTVQDGMITIKGVRKMEKEDKGEKHHRIESFYGRFARSFALPDDVEQDKIGAECKDGVLRVHLPKVKRSKPKAVQVAIR